MQHIGSQVKCPRLFGISACGAEKSIDGNDVFLILLLFVRKTTTLFLFCPGCLSREAKREHCSGVFHSHNPRYKTSAKGKAKKDWTC